MKRFLMGFALAAAVMVPARMLVAAGPLPVDLGTAGNFLVLSGAAITSSGGGIINGDVGASPITGAAIGLNPAQVVNGTIYATDAAGPAGSVVDPALLTVAKNDLTTAYNDAAGRITPIPVVNPGGGNLGTLNLPPGLYKFTSTALLTGGNLTLTGGPDDVWIFQIAADLQVDPGMQVILAGGAQARNVFWQVGTSATIGTSAVFKGTIMADQSITMDASSTLEGRVLTRIAQIVFNGASIGLSASVGDFVWYDTNPNGIQNAGEPGVTGVVVNLYGTNSVLVATTNTDVNGLYIFSNLNPGGYFLEFMLPAGYLFTLPGQDGVAGGSDADIVTGRTVPFTLFAGQSDTNRDAGLIQPGPAIGLVKTAGNAADGAVLYVGPGTNVVYTYQVINAGDTVLTNVVVTDDILGAVGTIGIMAPGATNYLYATNLNVTASVTNIGTAVGTLPTGGTVQVSDDADTRIDLFIGLPPQITKTASINPVQAGQLLIYTITVSNASQSAIVSNVTVVETYDAFFRYVSSIPTPRAGTSNIWDLGDLPPGYTTNIVIRGRVSRQALDASSLANMAVVFSDWGSRTVILNTRVINDLIPVTLLYFRAVTVAGGVKLKWETATEFENLGYNLYRADSLTGKRIRLNAKLIPGANSLDGQFYRFLDATARSGATYYYWLVEVAWNYQTETYGPAVRPASATIKPQPGQPALGWFRTTTASGLYRIRYETLAEAGLPVETLNPDRLAVRILGQGTPAFVTAAGPLMEPGDSLLFYAPASKAGLSCTVAVEADPARMRLVDAQPLRQAGDVYAARAWTSQRLRFKTDPSVVRYLLTDFTAAPVWVLDVTAPANAILLYGYAYVEIENGRTAVYLSYEPEFGSATCFAVQDEAVIDVPRVFTP